MEPILKRLPDPSSLDTQFAEILSSFSKLAAKAEAFFSADLASVLEDGEKLPIPDSLTLIGDTLNKLSQMAHIIPSDPEGLTVLLQECLNRLMTELTCVREILEPLIKTTDFISPLLENYTFLSDTVTRINNIMTLLSEQAGGLNLKDIPGQFRYISNLFNVFSEVVEVSPFKELKDQIDSIKTWLTMNSNDLTEYFRSQIQTLANALPAQLDDVMQEGLEALAVIENLLPALFCNAWNGSYSTALDAVESIDLSDLSQINDYLDLMDNQVTQVKAAVDNFTRKAMEGLEGLKTFGVNLFCQDLGDAFMNIIDTIAPEKPGILAVIFHQIRRMVGGWEISMINPITDQIEQEVDKLIGNMGILDFTDRIEDITDRIVSTVGMVDQALVEAALTLSNLVGELKDIIAKVNLPGLVENVGYAFGQLENLTKSLVTTVESIIQEINTFLEEVEQDVGDLNINGVKDAIDSRLSEITAVLDDPEIQHILMQAQKGIDEIAQNLEGVTLKPIFNQVVEEIGDLKKKLAAVDISELNDFLKMALMTALEVIKRIDFASEVSEKLEEQFKAILSQSINLINPIQERFEEIETHINQFNPGAIVSDRIAPPFEELVKGLNKIKPSEILSPLQLLQESLLDRFESFSPKTLIAPLSELHLQLVNALKSFSPNDIFKPLNELLSQITGLLDELGIEDLITKISESVNKMNSLINSFLLGEQIRKTDFWGILEQVQLQGSDILTDIESKLDQFLDQIMTYIPDIDISILQQPLDGVRASISTIKNHVNNPEALIHIDAMINHLNAQDYNGCITGLSQRWLAQKARFEQITPPPELAEQYTLLKEHLGDLSPIVFLAKPANLVDQIRNVLGRAQMKLAQTKGELVQDLTENQDKLDALLPDEYTSDSFKRLLRETLKNQIIKPIQEVIKVLKKRFQEFYEIFERVKLIVLKLKDPYDALTIIPESINRITDALIDAKNKITGINLNFLEDELQGVIDEVIAQLDALEPSKFLSPIETKYQNTVEAIKGLYPESLIQGADSNSMPKLTELHPDETEAQSLDKIYQEDIIQKLSELHPDETVAQPLDKIYQEDIIQKMDVFNVDGIFDVLNKKLNTIGQELEAGLDRTEKAFKGLLSALPGVSAGI